MYTRYFEIRSGALFDAANSTHQKNKKAAKEYSGLIEEIGAKSEYYIHNDELVALQFKNPDSKLYKKVKNGWYPKKSTNRDIYDRFSAVKTFRMSENLKLINLRDSPTIFKANRCYFPTINLIPNIVVFVGVPWYDEDPDVIERYKKDCEQGKAARGNIEALLWEPPQEMKEIKLWQVEKEIAEYNANLN